MNPGICALRFRTQMSAFQAMQAGLGLAPFPPLFLTAMPPLTPLPYPGSVLEQQAAAAAAAAAITAAAAVGAYNPLGGLLWMPGMMPSGMASGLQGDCWAELVGTACPYIIKYI